jgi:hypothetical protein
MVNRVETKGTNHKCKCQECGLPIVKGEVRVKINLYWYHARCFVDIVESIPDIETLWKNSLMKSVTERLKKKWNGVEDE